MTEHWFNHTPTCPDCGATRRITVRTLDQGWPIKCRKCGLELHLPLPEFEEPEVPGDWRRGVEPHRRYWKRCYEKAGQWLIRHLEGEMIFGLVYTDSGIASAHAWVMLPDGIVFDGVWQRFVRWEDYQRLLHAEAHHFLSCDEYITATVETGHYGPFIHRGWRY